MHVPASLFVVVGLLQQVLAGPNDLKVEERALKNDCNRDNLFRSFIDPRYSSSASAFCSTYIRSTVRATATTTTTVNAPNAKRDLPATTSYPASRLSSACSCILTAAPKPTTVTVTTKTVTTTKSASCSVATPIVKNGDFESGTLSPWALTVINNGDERLLTYGVKAPGFGGSKYAFIANDQAAASYVELDIEQPLTVCPGAKYKFTAKFYITDPGDQDSKKRQAGPKQVYVYAYVDNNFFAGTTNDDPAGPPIVWKTLTGTFTATSNTAQLKVAFVTTDFLGVEWGVDNVVVTPA